MGTFSGRIKRKVAVIGAGPAGICTAKNLIDDGHEPVIFEKQGELGGIWVYNENRPGGVYNTTLYQTTKFISCFTDFPFSAKASIFPEHQEVLAYVNDYADHFNIRSCCHFNTSVTEIQPEGDQWRVECEGKHAGSYLFDAVAVCTGQYWYPRQIRIPGMEIFRGELYHSAQYKNNASFRNKRVVVVGSGVSGMDIAVEASKTAQSVDWCVREKNWIKPRWFGFIPYEAGVTEGVHLSREEMLSSWQKGIPEFYEAYQSSGLLPDRQPFIEGFCANDDILFLIRDQKIKVRPPVQSLTENAVILEDGTRLEADVVVMAIGYQEMHLPFLGRKVQLELGIHEEGMDLYRHVFHPNLKNFAFIFHVAGNAPAMPVMDLQSQWVSKVWSGELQLPDAAEIRRSIEESREKKISTLNRKRYRSNFIDGAYLQELGEILKLLPDKTTNWNAYLETIAPPSFPMIYRLNGANAWGEAREAIEQSRKRYPLKSNHLGQLASQVLQRCTPKELLQMFRNGQISREELTEAFIRKKHHQPTDHQVENKTQPPAEVLPISPGESQTKGDETLESLLIEMISDLLKIDASELDAELDMSEYGFDSISLATFAKKLKERLEIEVSPSVFFGYTTITSFAGYLRSKGVKADNQAVAASFPAAAEIANPGSVLPVQPTARAEAEPQKILSGNEIPEAPRQTEPEFEGIAIIGMDAILPDSNDTSEYWDILINGKNTSRTIPEERFDWKAFSSHLNDPAALQWGSFIPDVEGFDADYFNIPEREAAVMDPQQRLLLQSVVHAMEDSGYSALEMSDRQTGVFIAASAQDYKELVAAASETLEVTSLAGLSPNMLANRISYLFDFNGPSEVIDTACSGFLVALHRAIGAIRQGDCDLAVVGGINLLLSPTVFISLGKAGLLSQDGRCKSFSKTANGYVRGEGLGTFVLKDARRAKADGDRIYAIVRASGVNHNGHSNSVLTPNPSLQANLIETTIRKSRVDPNAISYIEAQGTGSILGDETECRAISYAFEKLGLNAGYQCLIGTAKSNVGNLEAASGVASLVKVIMAMQHGIIPASIGISEPNPNLEMANGSLRLVTENLNWKPKPSNNGSLFACVHAFGFGGTNAHIVVESGSQQPVHNTDMPGPYIIILSAKCQISLDKMKADLTVLIERSNPSLASLAYTLQTGREDRPFRFAALVNDHRELLQALTKPGAFANCWNTSPRPAGGIVKALQRNNYTGFLIEQMMANNDRRSVALLWMEGVRIPWKSLYRSHLLPSRIALPAYPFNTSPFWVKRGSQVQQKPAEVPEKFSESNQGDEVKCLLLKELTGFLPASVRLQLTYDSSFAEIGLDSLGLMELREIINHRLDISFSVAELLELDTISNIADKMGTRLSGVTTRLEVPEVAENLSFPLTTQQKALSYIFELDPLSYTYNNLLAVKADTRLDKDALTLALGEMIRQQDLLRTRLVYENGIQVQIAEASIKPDLEFHSYEHSSQQEAEKFLEQEYKCHFELAQAPMWKMRVAYLPDGSTLLGIIIHHIIFDGSSSLAIVRQLFAHYFAALYKQPFSRLTHLQFRDFVREQDLALLSPKAEKWWSYWQNELHQAPAALQLPADFERPSIQTFNGDRIQLNLEKERTVKLQELSSRLGLTFNNLLLGAFYLTLSRFSGQEDIIIGVPSVGRSSRYLSLVGYFVNLLPIRVKAGKEMPVRQLLQQVQQKMLAGLDNDGLPFAEMVRRMDMERDHSRSPLFQACFVFQSWLQAGELVPNSAYSQLPGFKPVQLEPVLLDQQNGQFDIMLEVLEKEGICHFEFKYNTDIFHSDSVRQWVRAFESILDAMTGSDINLSIAALGAVKPDQLHKNVLGEPVEPSLNGRKKAGPVTTVVERIEQGKSQISTQLPESEPPVSDSWCFESVLNRVLNVFRVVMNRPLVTAEDNFFGLGGHSILAVQLMGSLRKEFEINISVVDIINNPAIQDLARFITNSGGKIGVDPAALAFDAPVTDTTPFPLSDMQQAFWTGQQGFFELGTTQPHLYIEYEDVNYDMARFNQAWHNVMMRHEMLRVRFLADGWQQVTADISQYRVPFNDISHLPPQAREEYIDAFREEFRSDTSGFEEWPFMLAVHRMNKTDVLHCKISLLICDGVSLGIIFRDFFRFYFDPEYRPGSLTYSFRNYIRANNELKATEEYARHKAYWMERIHTLPLAPELPLMASRAQQAMPMSRHEMFISSEQWRQIRESAAANSLMINSVLCTAYAKTLAYWSKIPHFSIVVMYFNRRMLHEDMPSLVGNFEIPSLLEIDFRERRSFGEDARRLQQRLLTDVEHNLFSGIDVLRELSLHNGQLGKAIVPVTFSSGLNIIDRQEVLNKSTGKMRHTFLQVPQVWIDHQVYDEPDGSLKVVFDVVDELFPGSTIQDMMNAYRQVLVNLAAEPESWITPLPTLIPDYQKRIIDATNLTARPIPQGLLYEPFVRAASQWPSATAVIDGDESFSFHQIDQLSNKVANYLRNGKVQPNEPVAIIIHKGWEQVPASIGIMKAGGAYLPVDVKMPLSRLEFIIKQAGVRHGIVTSEVLAEGVQLPESLQVLNISEGLPDESDAPIDPVNSQTDLAYVLFTSGSTGFPKGVMIDHRGALNTVTYINERYGITRHDRAFAISSLYFDLSVYDLFGVLGAGGALVFPSHKLLKDPEHWIEEIIKHHVTIWNSVPELMNLVIEFGRYLDNFQLPDLKYVMMSGDWIPITLPEKIRMVAPAARLISYGGATEASIWSNYFDIGEVDPLWKSIPYGKALENQSLHVFNVFMEQCPFGVIGDIYIGGIGVAKGYLNEPDKTAAQFVFHREMGEIIYKTGDLGRVMPDGNVEFLGRADFQVKIQGYRIELGEIEAVMLKHAGIKIAAADVKKDVSGTSLLVGYYVPETDNLSEDTVIRHLAKNLQDYMVPKLMVKLDELPLTSNGKVDRKKLPMPAKLLEKNVADQEVQATWMQRPEVLQLAEIWKEVLSQPSVAPNDNFFEKGGNSLLAIRMKVAIQKRLGIQFQISSLFEHSGFADIVREVCSKIPVEQTIESLITIRKTGSQSPLFLAHAIGGSVYTYTKLARVLSPEQPVYAFQAIGFDSDKKPVCSVPEMAKAYIREMKTIQPVGPYNLGGWSFGGIICFEMAWQLEQRGEKVERIFLIDSYFNQFHHDYESMSEFDLLDYYLKDLAQQSTQQFDPNAINLDELINSAVEAGILPQGIDRTYILKLLNIFRANCIAYELYKPSGRINAGVWKFVADDDSYLIAREEADIWNQVINGTIREIAVPGNHFTIFGSQHIETMSFAINQALHQVSGVQHFSPTEIS